MTNTTTALTAHYFPGKAVRVNLPATTGKTVAYVSRIWDDGETISVVTFDGRGGIVRNLRYNWVEEI